MSELDKAIGTKEKPRLTAGSVIVDHLEVKEQESTKRKGAKFKIINFYCKHPDREEQIQLSNMMVLKVQGNNKTISRDGIWYREDEDGNVDKNCNAALVMKHYHKSSLKQFEGSPIDTELDTAGYLAIKSY